MNSNINLVSKKDCSGCSACYNICPQHAITMLPDSEGFKYPCIDEGKCSGCGLCLSVCQRVAPPPKLKPHGLIAVAKDNIIRQKSSSGGVFSIFANHILENGGYVCAAAFDDNWSVNHIIINDKKDLDKLRRSKYVQSNMNNCYSRIKKLLNDEKLVFFVGTPCQVDGLNKFLQYKKYDNLLTMDLYCHSAPSPFVFEKLIEEHGGKENISCVNFRDKSRGGWKKYDFTIETKDGTKHYNNEYVKAFVNGYFSRQSCYSCKYAKFPRVSDITGADFWGAPEEYDDNTGTSILLINSKKGKNFLEKVKHEFKVLKNMPLKKFGHNGLKKLEAPYYRENFRKDIQNMPASECLEKYTGGKAVAINNLYYSENYGAMFVGYSMQKIVEGLGYLPYHIKSRYTPDPVSKKFIDRYINTTSQPESNTEYLNNTFETFIAGSDQVWNLSILKHRRLSHLFPDISNQKKKIGYAVSFGHPNLSRWENDYHINALKYYTTLFDYVSVREYDGADICKNELGINSTKVLDPTLVLDKNEWNKLAKNSEFYHKTDKYIAVYILDENDDKNKILNTLQEFYNYKVIKINLKENQQTPEDFIALIKNAQYVVTDSFHGVCFSIIFNKQFLAVYNERRGLSRFKTLEKQFGIGNQFIKEFIGKEKIIEIINSKIDYENIEKIKQKESEASIRWLKSSIEKEKTKHPTPQDYMFEYQKEEFKHVITFLLNKNTINRKFQIYKILRFITFGHLKNKYKKYKKLRKELKEIQKTHAL